MAKLKLVVLLVLWLTIFGCSCFAQDDSASIPVVLSTDVGNEIDDQWAITYLLLQPRFQVLGIMSAHAPTIAAPAGATSKRILTDVVENRLGMMPHPPLVEGASGPLSDSSASRRSRAVDFLIDQSRKFSKNRRLNVLMIGAATDVASAILIDRTIVDRIRVIQMGFNDENGGEEFNVANDVRAVQIILGSNVPLVIGPGKVCRESLSLSLEQARKMLSNRGVIGAWLWEEYQAWYFRYVKPLRVDDFSKSWVIWDDITLAYLLGMTTQHTVPRPRMRDDMKFEDVKTDQVITWITDVDEERLWNDFLSQVDEYQRRHHVRERKYGRLTFGMP
jgi:inosine-uridine nucleoside N-ribohydrolase